MFRKIAAGTLLLQLFSIGLYAQLKTNTPVLTQASAERRASENENYQKALRLAPKKGWQQRFTTASGNQAQLVGVDSLERPIYFITESNVIAAATTGANKLWNGGSSGLNLSGSSNSVKGKLAVWDGGRVLANHVELTGRVIQKDGPPTTSDHATHVAGTMIASGVLAAAKGMAYGMQDLQAYDFSNDISEMFNAAPGLLLSNHSYGTLSGWSFNSSQNRWEFYGKPGANEDENFGYYNGQAQLLDSLAYNAPYYLIVKSSGNNRGETGPAVGTNYFRYDASGQMVSAGPRPAGMSSNDSYDVISTYGNAKNILTVGAVNGIANGYTNTNDVVMSGFSSWGPTDDGRIKPDVVADGVNLQSSIASASNAYGIYSGTSMATPNTSGSLLLVQEYYAQRHNGAFMRAATLKGLAIHSADEAGPTPGPDYKFGWGLLNVAKAADVVKSDNTQSHMIFENVLENSGSFTLNVVASGPLTATIAWTDPKGNVVSTNVLNNNSKKLINDLDIRIVQGTTTFLPWILDPANPSAAATTGDNTRDNVEKINIPAAVAGTTYTIQITHKGTLERGLQAYSLILSGVNGQSFCVSAPTSTAGARIDSVSFAGINQKNAGSCTGYSNFTNIVSPVEAGQIVPFHIALNSCDATVASKIVKLFIDINTDGDFSDAGELVATSAVINGNGVFSGNITMPSGLIYGVPTTLRIVAQETNDPVAVNACGSYGQGETQDYRLLFSQPSNDVRALSISGPALANCANGEQYVTVNLRNVGTATQTAIPLAVEVKEGTNVVMSSTGLFNTTIDPGETKAYTFQKPFAAMAGSTYTISVLNTASNDQVRENDTVRLAYTVSAAPAAPSDAQARICGTNAVLSSASAATYYWYSNVGGSLLGAGSPVTTSTIAPNNTYYATSGARVTAGLASKSGFANGGGYVSGTNAYVKYNSSTPLVLESARLYSKTRGKVEVIVGLITFDNGTNFQYSTVASKVIDVYPTTPNTGSGTQAGYDAADTGAVYQINLSLPAGSTYAIITRVIGTANLFRNNNVTGSPYPMGVPGLFTLTGNSAGTEGGTLQNYYYFLYDMKLRSNACPSIPATVVASVATPPTITQAGNTLTSSSTTGNQWLLNGQVLGGEVAQSYTAIQSGVYSVRVTDNQFCTLTSNTVTFAFTAIDPTAPAENTLGISPNPAKRNFQLTYRNAGRQAVKLEVLNGGGQIVYSKTYGQFNGTLSQTVNLGNLASGFYLVRVTQGKLVQTRKLILE